jgi:putative membrane protein
VRSRDAYFDFVVADPRTLEANERTMLAWLRTSASLITLGFGVAKLGQWLHQTGGLPRGISVAELFGATFVLLGALAAVLALVRYYKVRNALVAGAPFPIPGPAIAIIVGFVAFVGVVLGVYILMFRSVA